MFARVRSLWRGLRERADVEADMSDEFRLHIELRARDLERAGLLPEAALLRARREFGSTERFKEEARGARGLRSIDELRFSWLDFKLGLRMLSRYPGLTVVGGLAMAVAIAIGASAFEAIKQVVWPRLPFPDGDRIVALRNWDMAANRAQPTQASDFIAWREQLEAVRDVGAYRTIVRNLIDEQGKGTPIALAEISASAFRITGIAPVLGRFPIDADEQAGAHPVMVIRHDVWQSRFAGDSAVIGRIVRLGSMPVTIVGVMPAGFAFPFGHSAWTTLRLNAAGLPRDAGPELDVFGRLAPGVTLEEAQTELSAVGRRAANDLPATHGLLRPQIGRYAESNSPIYCSGMSWTRCLSLVRTLLFSSNLIFVVLLVLICANVALLMFARAAARESEIIVRSALGASRGRIITQLVAEALVLGALAAVIGLAVAGLALKTGVRLMEFEGQIPFWWRPSLSLPSVLYAVGLTFLGATIAGALPALKVTRGLGVQLRQATPGGGGLQFGGVWTFVIVAQVALTVVAVAATVYIGQFAARAASFELDFPAHEYLSAQLQMDDEIPATLYQELEQQLLREPGVTGVTFASRLPGSPHEISYFEVDGLAAPPWVQTAAVDADFFRTMNVPMVAGRAFLEADFLRGRHVVVVNEAFVQRVLEGRNPVGRRVRFKVSEDRESRQWGPWHEIVGVARQITMTQHPEMSPAGLYFPLQAGASSVQVAVHLRHDPESFVPRLRTLATTVEPALQVHRPLRLDRIAEALLRVYGTGMRILIGVSLLVLALSLAGIYSIMSFTVSRRTREIGIRLALGADRRRIIASIFPRPLAQVSAGVLLGVGLSVLYLRGEVKDAVAGGFNSLQEAAIILAFTVAMFAVCMLACVVPTRRALGIQPTEALKSEV